jgi:diphthamide synthase (EF-2-diphthine--ammonia ligase)
MGTPKDDDVQTKLDETITDGMTPAERAALGLDDDETKSYGELLSSLKEEQSTDGPDEDDDGDESVSSEEDDSGAASKAAAEKNEPAQQNSSSADQAPPAITAQPVEGLDTKLQELATQRSALRDTQTQAESALLAKFESADLDLDDYQKQLSELRKKADEDVEAIAEKRLELKQQASEFERQQSQQQDFYANLWKRDVESFVAQAAKAGVNYEDDTKPILRNAFNAEILRLNKEEPNLDNKSLLTKAHQSVLSQLGIKASVSAATKPTAQAKSKPEIPPNIGRLPAASGNMDDSGDKFAQLDKLGGFELEKALAQLSDEERMEYLAA